MTRKITLKHYLTYGSGDFFGMGTTALTGAWLLFFYTNFCHLSAVEAASIFAIARVFDAIASPLMGYITDNFGHTLLGKKFGRRKFFILLGIPAVFSYCFIWVSDMGYLYYLLTYLVFELVYSMVLVPYETLVPEMTDDFKKKTRFSGARISFAQLSYIITAYLPAMFFAWYGKDNPDAFFYAGLVIAVICAVALTLVYCNTWERERPSEEQKPADASGSLLKRFFSDALSTLKVKAFRTHLGMYLGGFIAQDVFNAVFTYYVIYVLFQTATVSSELLGIMSIMQLIAVLSMIPLCIHWGPAPAYRLAVGFFALACLTYGFLWLGDFTHLAVLMLVSAVAGFGRGGINYIPWNTYTYMADVDEAITGLRREGIFAGVMTMTRKASQAVAVMIVGVLLQLAHFNPGQPHQPESVHYVILAVLSLGTTLLLAAGYLVSRSFTLNIKTHAVLRQECDRMRLAGGPIAPVSKENQRILEDITGFAYQDLWGNNKVSRLSRQTTKGIINLSK
ncbi:MFS transporter [Dryocola sp. BD586]|uniref:MFS transporter n=1 Tax=Dryocola sp. BD586 TaxID=3133271 RepID=UPI003F4FF1DC